MKKYFLILLFLLTSCWLNNETNMNNSDCLTESNFEKVISSIIDNEIDNNFDINYINTDWLNRLSFSRKWENYTLWFIVNEDDWIRVLSTLKNVDDNNKIKAEIENTFCDILKNIN